MIKLIVTAVATGIWPGMVVNVPGKGKTYRGALAPWAQSTAWSARANQPCSADGPKNSCPNANSGDPPSLPTFDIKGGAPRRYDRLRPHLQLVETKSSGSQGAAGPVGRDRMPGNHRALAMMKKQEGNVYGRNDTRSPTERRERGRGEGVCAPAAAPFVRVQPPGHVSGFGVRLTNTKYVTAEKCQSGQLSLRGPTDPSVQPMTAFPFSRGSAALRPRGRMRA